MPGRDNRQTRLIELVETHNIAKSLTRIRKSPGYGRRLERALHHALSIACSGDEGMLERVRVALKLP